jgi:hypothetical protein
MRAYAADRRDVGGHGVAMTIVACGFDGFNLTYFGSGFVRPTPCGPGTWTSHVIIQLAGLAVTIPVGAVAMVLQRRAGLTPLTRLLVALLATGLLLRQLWYATSGGYYEIYDPQLAAGTLEYYGLHVLAWLPTLVLFAAAVLYGARAIVQAFREHFGSRSRLQGLKQSVATLGAAWLLYAVALRIEAAIRTDMIPSAEVAVEQRAAANPGAPWLPNHRFPIGRVLLAIAVAAFVLALARPVRRREGAEDAAPGRIPRRYAVGVAVAAFVCAVTITLLVRV